MLRTYFQKMAEPKTNAQGAKLEQTQEEKDLIIADLTERVKAQEEKDRVIAELTERVKLLQNGKTSADDRIVTLNKVQYKLMYPFIKYNGIEYDYEALLANPSLCEELIELNAGVFVKISK
jgi:hypothetical protein